jgi:hypothetical protein
MKTPKIIYFIDGPVPSPADKAEANVMRGKGIAVVFRNARFIDFEGGAGEPTDGVTGAAIPAAYKDFKSAEEVIAVFQAALAAEAAAVHPLSEQLATGGAAGAPVVPTVVAPVVPIVPVALVPGAFVASPAPTTFTAPVPQQ